MLELLLVLQPQLKLLVKMGLMEQPQLSKKLLDLEQLVLELVLKQNLKMKKLFMQLQEALWLPPHAWCGMVPTCLHFSASPASYLEMVCTNVASRMSMSYALNGCPSQWCTGKAFSTSLSLLLG
jgi:hypothetical protein